MPTLPTTSSVSIERITLEKMLSIMLETICCVSSTGAAVGGRLAQLLDSDSAKAKENSVSAITQLANNSLSNQTAIAKLGGGAPLAHRSSV